ncbi:uncharacterized protein LOC135398425 [Ornithodoros turicata]|uniref:uncharacterized protein LOC135398425 n=1 Tax=Ornithodoros turicata TaxID=34597 RepID=UPI0031393E3D
MPSQAGLGEASSEITSSSTGVCGGLNSRRSCSKTCIVKVYPKTRPEQAVRMYAMLDDQSNRSLARPEFFERFGIRAGEYPYTLRTCAGVVETTGRRASGYVVESLTSKKRLDLPTLIECDEIPNNRHEIPTPDVARRHPHLKALASLIPPMDPEAQILLLIGRDLVQAHKVRQQRNGPNDAPFAQKLDLGWVIVGDVCVDRLRTPEKVDAFATTVLGNGRPSSFMPCHNHVLAKENLSCQHPNREAVLPGISPPSNEAVDPLFQTTREDETFAPSVEDQEFLNLMDREFRMDALGNWVAPLPFRTPRRKLPDNREQALSRFNSLRRTLDRKPEMKQHFVAFIEDLLKNGHAEPAPPRDEYKEYWYLPSFGVYHPQKPGQIRVVFGSSAKHQGISLNDLLLSGPDMTNSLVGVLLRFRKEAFAVTADIQRMFYCFFVREEDRDYLRFLWFRDNDTSSEVIEYRMCVHVFGNTCSPAIATYGLRRTAKEAEPEFGADVRRFVARDFYVDDGLISLSTEKEAIELLKRTQKMLMGANLRLHKFASNSVGVMDAFPSEDYDNDLKNLDLSGGNLPIQRSLGLNWNLRADTFTFRVPARDTPSTRRGVLLTVKSLYDPLGMTAPVTVQGRLLLRELTSCATDCDAPLVLDDKWQTWKDSLRALERLEIPRQYVAESVTNARRREICVFSDASEKIIAAVAYIRVTDSKGTPHTILRLELCAAVLAVEIAELVVNEIDVHIEDVRYYTDSKVVLGYICNQSRRFYLYVSNLVNRLRRSTKPEQWHYVPTDQNPADHATGPVAAAALTRTTWLTRPKFLHERSSTEPASAAFPLHQPEVDPDIRPQVSVSATFMMNQQLGTHRFKRFSSWTSLVKALASLVHIARSFLNPSPTCHEWHHCNKPRTAEELAHAKKVILRSVQHEEFAEITVRLRTDVPQRKHFSTKRSLWKLDPYIDNDDLLRVGGRLRNANMNEEENTRLLFPVGTTLVYYCFGTVMRWSSSIREGTSRKGLLEPLASGLSAEKDV